MVVDWNILAVEVLGRNSEGWSAGSGYFIRPGLVLTACHCVEGQDELFVRIGGEEEYPAVVCLQGDKEGVDLALLEVSGVSLVVPSLRYGKVDKSVRGTVKECSAIGFPWYKLQNGKRYSAQIDGEIPIGDNLNQLYLTLQIKNKDPRPRTSEQSEWAGISGAVVFSNNNVVVGVIVQHHLPEGESALTVVPVMAIDLLADKDEWWQRLGTDSSRLISLPIPQVELRKEGLHVWTETDLRRYHSLREEFVYLSQVFDAWLASEPQKRGQRIRVLWLQGEEGEHRKKALLSCLSGMVKDYPPIYDAGMNLGLLVETLKELLFSESYMIPPLISVELNANEQETAWTDMRNILASAEKQFAEEYHLYPRLIVAGSGEQAQQAWQTLQDRLEIKIIDTKGHDLERPYSFHGVHGMDSATVFGEDVFNRGLPITTKRLFGRKDELEILTRSWNSERCRIVSIVAYGGTGKSALVNTWLSQMRDQDYLGARKVFAWSFYSQGTKENLVSADVFVSQALTWLAPNEPVPLNRC